ncbi:MAG: GAF domain-containing sensor histidine kinase [Chloroflexota bacterium]
MSTPAASAQDASLPVPSAAPGLPLLALAEAVDAWERQPDDATQVALLDAMALVIATRGAQGGWIRLRVAPWPRLDAPIGAPATAEPPSPGESGGWVSLDVGGGRVHLGEATIDGPEPVRRAALAVLGAGLELAWGRTEARVTTERLDALYAATAAITAELSVERVLQVIVDKVRPLVGARYAALGILGEHGGIERFITSGVDDATRRSIGHLPRGHGVLGVIIREGVPLRLDDLTRDPRSIGFPSNHPPMHSFLGVPVTVEGHAIGNLYLTDKQGGLEFSADDQRLVENFARQAGIAIHNAQLHEEVQNLAVLQERERIGQDLHDGIIQALYAVGLMLEDVGDLMQDDPADAAARVETAIEGIHGTIRDIRNFIFGLRPELLEDVDLRGGLANLADEFRRSTLIDTELVADDAADLDPEDAIQLLQLAREALSNVARHADASHVTVELTASDGMLRLVIGDDGRGFDPTASRGPAHHGLTNMRARAESLGGTLTMDSRPGGGTRVMFQVPQDAGAHTGEDLP